MSKGRAAAFEAYINNHKERLRPILVALNCDHSWLVSIPRPPAERESSGKVFFHIVSDPWLAGPSVQWTQWLTHITLPSEPEFKNGDSVEGLVDAIETAAAEGGLIRRRGRTNLPRVDAIFLGIAIDDHTHRPTLETFDSRIPIVASPDAADLVRSWNYFDSVTAISDLKPGGSNWHDLHPGGVLPPWLSFLRVGFHGLLYFATAIVWTLETGENESIFMTPHSINHNHPSVQTYIHNLAPPINTLAMFCPLKDNLLFGKALTQGGVAGLAIARQIKPKYWIKSADAKLQYAGMFFRALFVQDIKRTFEEALEAERRANGGEVDPHWKQPKVIEVDSGSCFVLE